MTVHSFPLLSIFCAIPGYTAVLKCKITFHFFVNSAKCWKSDGLVSFELKGILIFCDEGIFRSRRSCIQKNLTVNNTIFISCKF